MSVAGPVPFVHSRYPRIADDDYQTIDRRCVQALVETWDIKGHAVDICAPQGSGIVDGLQERGMPAVGMRGLPGTKLNGWIVTNPPYKRGLVDDIATDAAIFLSRGMCLGVAFLMRANWDLAACRSHLFDPLWYAGQTRMRFRPWWSEERKAQPIHNFVWHVWEPTEGEPVVRYWPRNAE